MRIGIDISPLQGPHSMRGVGTVVRNFIKHIPEDLAEKHTYVLFAEADDNLDEVLNEIEADKLNYKLVKINRASTEQHRTSGKVNKVKNKLKSLTEMCVGRIILGSSELSSLKLDHYIQFDPCIALPKLSAQTKSIIMTHDLIPLILEKDYMWSYKTARRNKYSLKASLSTAVARFSYKLMLKQNVRRANIVLANSNHTKSDVVKLLRCPEQKVVVTHLGVSQQKPNDRDSVSRSIKRYQETSWGSLGFKSSLPDKSYLLYAGGADPRRKLADLFAAYNNLRARGTEIALVLVGDTMLGANGVPQKDLRDYLMTHNSFAEDVYFLGYVEQSQLDWLYKNALAFVYPSVYEGFGLPVLEAMNYGTPVITYRNTSIKEIGGTAALYAHDQNTIVLLTQRLLKDKDFAEKIGRSSVKQATRFTWENTARKILELLK